MKTLLNASILLIILIISSCSNDDDEGSSLASIIASDIFETVDENSNVGTAIATINAMAENTDEALTYTIINQSPANAIRLNGTTLEVADLSLFDFETRTEITGQIEIAAGGATQTIDFIITINDIEEPFVTTWRTTTPNEAITIAINNFSPTISTPYDYTVDWGDGIISISVFGDAIHNYSDTGIHTVSITGDFPAIFNTINEPNAAKLQTIERWGDIAWETMFGAFADCTNLTLNATDTPDLSNVTDISAMFGGATSFNEDISTWDVSTITTMISVFRQASSFNQDISDWDVSNVTIMSDMFFSADSFNQDVSTWEVNNVENMSRMFDGAISFNQDISNWDVSNVTSCINFSFGAPLTSVNTPNFTNCVP